MFVEGRVIYIYIYLKCTIYIVTAGESLGYVLQLGRGIKSGRVHRGVSYTCGGCIGGVTYTCGGCIGVVTYMLAGVLGVWWVYWRGCHKLAVGLFGLWRVH